jgi:hypothetical protein
MPDSNLGKTVQENIKSLVDALRITPDWTEDAGASLIRLADDSKALLDQWLNSEPFEFNSEGGPSLESDFLPRIREAVFAACQPAGLKEYAKSSRNFNEAGSFLDKISGYGSDSLKLRSIGERVENLSSPPAESPVDVDYQNLDAEISTEKQHHLSLLFSIYVRYLNLPYSDIAHARQSGDPVFLERVIVDLQSITSEWESAMGLEETNPSLKPDASDLQGTRLGVGGPDGQGIKSFVPRADLVSLQEAQTQEAITARSMAQADKAASELNLDEAALLFDVIALDENAKVRATLPMIANLKASHCREAMPLVAEAREFSINGDWEKVVGSYSQALEKIRPSAKLEGLISVAQVQNTLNNSEFSGLADPVTICSQLVRAREVLSNESDLEIAEDRYRAARAIVLTTEWLELDEALSRGDDAAAKRIIGKVESMLLRNDIEIEELATKKSLINDAAILRRQIQDAIKIGPLAWSKNADLILDKMNRLGPASTPGWLVQAHGLVSDLSSANSASGPGGSPKSRRDWAKEISIESLGEKYPAVGSWISGSNHVQELVSKLDTLKGGGFSFEPHLPMVLKSLALAIVIVIVGALVVLQPWAWEGSANGHITATCDGLATKPVCDYIDGPQFLTFAQNNPNLVRDLGLPKFTAQPTDTDSEVWEQLFEHGRIRYSGSDDIYHIRVIGSGWSKCYYLSASLLCE